jgi:hypothetical protein
MTDGFIELMSAETTDHIIELIPQVVGCMYDEEWKKEKRYLCELQSKLIKRKGLNGWKLDYAKDYATEDVKILIYNAVYAPKPTTICNSCGKEFYKKIPSKYRNYCSTECFSSWGNTYCKVFNKGIYSHYTVV